MVFGSKTDRALSAPTFSNYWSIVQARAALEFDFYHATKHYGAHYWTKLGLEPRVIAAQAGWDIKGVEKLVDLCGRGEVGLLMRLTQRSQTTPPRCGNGASL